MDTRQYVEAFPQDLAQRKTDFQQKVANVRKHVLKELNLDAVVLAYSHNFAWLTNGARNYINMATDAGVGSIYVDATRVIVLTNNIEGHRLINEEMDGLQAEVSVHEDKWYAQNNLTATAKTLATGDNIAIDMSHDAAEAKLGWLRVTLTDYEAATYRSLGGDCGTIIGDVARNIRPSMTEWEIAGQLSAQCWVKGITPIVLLIAADERVDTIRHPLPTNKRVKNKVMLVLCGRRGGFVLSVTRMVYITTTPNATIPADLLRRHEVATFVDATALSNTVPGKKPNEVFKAIQDAYKAKGFDGEWELHHQGGAAGYKSREWIANPELNSVVVGKNQAYAWNPSVTGTKSEDTVFFKEDATSKTGVVHEVLSITPGWPVIEHTIDGVTYTRPAILHIAY